MDQLEITIQDALGSTSQYLVTTLKHSDPSKMPIRIDGGAICVCTKGEAKVSIDTKDYTISPATELLLFPDMTVRFYNCSTDFTLSLFIFSKSIFQQALVKFDPLFFQAIYSRPVHAHIDGAEETTLSYFKILRKIGSDSRNSFRNVIAMNLLRSMMLDIYDKISRFYSKEEHTIENRKEELYHKFMLLISEFSKEQRNVGFYAQKLCITPRYLAEITESIAKETPKETIDIYIIQEIKLILTFSEMTIQQIADYMNFPDQSYLGRYFKHHTGISPANYRKKIITM